jgi:hypothetical protein
MGKKETPWIIADCPGRVQICPSWALRARQAGRAAPAWRLWAGRNGPPRLGREAALKYQDCNEKEPNQLDA